MHCGSKSSSSLLHVVLVLLFASLHTVAFVPSSFHSVVARGAGTRRASTEINLPPVSYDEAASRLVSSLYEVLRSSSSSSTQSRRLYSLDLLTPGLNVKLEQKAILRQEYLFQLVTLLFPVLSSTFPSSYLCFSSAGETAGFQKYLFQQQKSSSSSSSSSTIVTTFTSLSCIPEDASCAVFVAAKNNVGDPVLRVVQEIVESRPNLVCLFLNCDLSDKVATGLQQRGARDAFRSSIAPVYYFRNIVQVTRPSLIPFELGALLYEPRAGWRIFAANEADIVGPGSLNRFCSDQPVFEKDPKDPTAANPPRFVLCGSGFDSMPKRDDIDTALTRASFLLSKAEKNKEEQEELNVESLQQAVEILSSSSSSSSSSLFPGRLLAACLYLKAQGDITTITTTESTPPPPPPPPPQQQQQQQQRVVSLTDDSYDDEGSMPPPLPLPLSLKQQQQQPTLPSILNRLQGKWRVLYDVEEKLMGALGGGVEAVVKEGNNAFVKTEWNFAPPLIQISTTFLGLVPLTLSGEATPCNSLRASRFDVLFSNSRFFGADRAVQDQIALDFIFVNDELAVALTRRESNGDVFTVLQKRI